MMTDLHLVFAGSPTAAVPSLTALAGSRHSVDAVITREDSPRGRRGVVTPTPVASEAASRGIPLIKANRLDGGPSDAIGALAPDIGVIVAYGGMVREPLLSVPRLGWINLHFSLLPRWRGAAPVQRAIMADDRVTGATVFQLVQELDAGDVLGVISAPILPDQTAGSLLEDLSVSGADLLLRVIDSIGDGRAAAHPQVGEVTLAPKLALSDGKIDWAMLVENVYGIFRGVTPEPGAWTTVDGVRLKVLAAGIAHGLPPVPAGTFHLVGRRVIVGTSSYPIELLQVQPEGRKAMDAASWWRGRPAGFEGTRA